MLKIMIVEDDDMLREQLAQLLKYEGYDVMAVTDFTKVEETFNSYTPDLVLLDINLPYFDGHYYCRVFRRRSNSLIIVTSARNSDADQILSMELGADEYITKPYNVQVLIAKVNALMRRIAGEYSSKEETTYNGLALNDKTFTITYYGRTTELSKNEYRLLKKLISEKGGIVSREDLLMELWDDSSFVDDNTLTVNVTRLKNRLSEIGIDDVIKTKRGMGYYFNF